MKQTHLAARDMTATTKMVAAAEELARLFSLDPNLLTGIQTQKGDPSVRVMLQREAVATFLEQLIKKVRAEQKAAEKTDGGQGGGKSKKPDDSPPASGKKSAK